MGQRDKLMRIQLQTTAELKTLMPEVLDKTFRGKLRTSLAV